MCDIKLNECTPKVSSDDDEDDASSLKNAPPNIKQSLFSGLASNVLSCRCHRRCGLSCVSQLSQARRPDICSTPSSCSILAIFPNQMGKNININFIFVRRCSMSHCFWPFVVPSTFFFLLLPFVPHSDSNRISVFRLGKVDGSARWRRLHGPLADQITQLSEQQTKHMPVRLIKHSGLPVSMRLLACLVASCCNEKFTDKIVYFCVSLGVVERKPGIRPRRGGKNYVRAHFNCMHISTESN